MADNRLRGCHGYASQNVVRRQQEWAIIKRLRELPDIRGRRFGGSAADSKGRFVRQFAPRQARRKRQP
jgi:hypothetical protein